MQASYRYSGLQPQNDGLFTPVSTRSNWRSSNGDISNTSQRTLPADIAIAKHEASTAPPLQGWPSEAHDLKKSGFVYYLTISLDIMLLLVPLCFAAIAALAKHVDGADPREGSLGHNLIIANRYGVTAFPILFAAISGRSLEMIATALIERGATIGLLEQLFGSTTVAATIKTQIMLRQWNFVAPLLFALWALSPLGAQGNLRVLSIETVRQASQQQVAYLNTSIKSILIHDPGYQISGINALYLSSMMAPNATQFGARDTWGNVKIPEYGSLDNVAADSEGWKNINAESSTKYSSLVGIPIGNVSKIGHTDFVMTSSYFRLECPHGPQLLPYDDEVLWFDGNVTGHLRGSGKLVNGTGSQRFPSDDFNGESGGRVTFSIGTFDNFNVARDRLRSIYFQSYTSTPDADLQNITALNCVVSYPYVDSKISCTDQTCSVSAIRPSSQTYASYLRIDSSLSKYTTPLDDEIVGKSFFAYFAVASGYEDSAEEYLTSSLTEQYMELGYNPIVSIDQVLQTNLSTVDGQALTQRLARLLNTWYIPSLAIESITYPSTSLDGGDATALATHTISNQVYRCHDVWFNILLLSSGVLFLCGLTGTILKYSATHGPDILGHVSSLTRDNPYVHEIWSNSQGDTGNALDGFERARLLRRVRIKLGDCRSTAREGHLVIMSASGSIKGSVDPNKRYM